MPKTWPTLLPKTLLLLCGLAAACGNSSTAPPPVEHANGLPPEQRPPPDTRILCVDGIDFTYADVQPFVEFYDRFYPKWTLAAKVRRTLDAYLLPLRFAQRDFKAERAAVLEQARGLVTVAGNVVELEQKAGPTGKRKSLTMQQLELPLAVFLFDRSKIGSCSPPIELPQGCSVVGAFDVVDGGVLGDDVVDAMQVPFFTHADKDDFDKWLARLRPRCADKVSYVHPDFRNAVPEWLKLP